MSKLASKRGSTRLTQVSRPFNVMLLILVCGVTVAFGMQLLFFSRAATITTVPTQASSVHDFLDSLGVNVHGAGYEDYTNATVSRVVTDLNYLGMSHIRDNVGAGDTPSLTALSAAGIHFLLDMPAPPTPGQSPQGGLPILMGYAKKFLSSTDGIEGSNEVDNLGTTTWAGDTRANEQYIHDTLKADSTLKTLPIVAASLTGNILSKATTLGNLSPWIDFGNIHSYPGNEYPEQQSAHSFVSRLNAERSAMFSGPPVKPFVTTETGYHDLVSYTGGHKPVSAAAAGIYMPRDLLEIFRAGSQRTYIYELLDQVKRYSTTLATNNQAHFGLFDGNNDPKPAAVAIHNMTTILHDTTDITPGKLNYCTCDAPADIHQVLLQHSNGSYYLAIWRANGIWDANTNSVVNATATEPVTVNFNQAYALSTYKPNSNTTATILGNLSNVTLNIDSRVTLLKIGAGSAATPTPTASATPTPTPTRTITSTPTPKPSATPISPIEGDMTNDSKVNVFDLSYLLSKWGTADPKADMDHNSVVNIFDLSQMLADWTG